MEYRWKNCRKKFSDNPWNRHFFIFLLILTVFLIGIYSFYYFSMYRTSSVCEKLDREITYDKTNVKSEIAYILKLEENNPYLSARDKTYINGVLSNLYSLQSDYENSVQYSIQSIYYGEKCGNYASVAWLYVDLANIYLDLGAYDRAEETVLYALDYFQEKASRDPMNEKLEKFAYLNLAEIYSMTGQNEASLKYLGIWKELIQEDDSNLELAKYTSHIIYARVLLNQKKYEECERALQRISDVRDMSSYPDEFWRDDVALPYWELYAALCFSTGRSSEGVEAGQRLMEMSQLSDDDHLKADFVKSLITIASSTEAQTDDGYQKMLVQAFPYIVQQRNQLTAEFITYFHGNTLEYYRANDRKRQLFQILAVGVIISFLMLYYIFIVRRAARTDGLTGVYNRKLLDSVMKRHIGGREMYGIIMVDLDYFKSLNDQFGHHFGDRVLVDTTKAIRRHLTSRDMFFRYGGEEFCILTRGADLHYSVKLAEQMRAEVEQLHWEKDVEVTISVGVAHSEQTANVMELADVNLYKAKTKGRNQVCWEEYMEQ